MSGKRAFNGDSEPVSGSDGNTFEEGHSESKKHGLYQDAQTFFEQNPDAQEEREELIEDLKERAQDPVLHRMEIKRYATISVKLERVGENLGAIDSSETWKVYRSLSTDARQMLKSITWSDEVEREEQRIESFEDLAESWENE